MTQIRDHIESAKRRRGAALMGVVNVTPDSFYDGGRFFSEPDALRQVDLLLERGADLLDLGGESSRPGAEPVSAEEQIARLEAPLRHALSRRAWVSIDTTNAEVADFALALGAHVINDVSCLSDPDLAAVVGRHGAALLLTHSRGPMRDMRGFSQWPEPAYGDIVRDVLNEWGKSRERACEAGIAPQDVWLDPGLGFSKNAHHCFQLMNRLGELRRAEALLVLGPGRKSFIAAVDASAPRDRLGGTVAACLLGVQRGADVLRVHDIDAVRQALAVARAVDSPSEARHAG